MIRIHQRATPREREHEAPRPELAAALLSAVIWAALGCRQLVAADDFSVREDVEPTPTFETWSQACHACMVEHCESETQACSDAAACARLSACLAEGSGPAGRATCEIENATGRTAFGVAERCLRAACRPACRGSSSFACLDSVRAMPTPTAEQLSQDITVVDSMTERALAGVRVRACTRLGWADPACSHSLSAEGLSDQQGEVALVVPFPLLSVKRPWDGYLLATGADLLPDLRVFSTPRTHDFSFRQGMLTLEGDRAVNAALGVERSPREGTLSVTVYDCHAAPASGVIVDLVPRPAGVRRAYARGSQYDESVAETQAEGSVLFPNVPASQPLTLRATVAATGALLNELDVMILPGTRTAVELEPRVKEQ